MTHGEVAAAGGMPRAARVIASLTDALRAPPLTSPSETPGAGCSSAGWLLEREGVKVDARGAISLEDYGQAACPPKPS